MEVEETGIVILIYYALQLYMLMILARALLSWLPNLDPSHPIVRFLFQATEPVLKPIRDLMPAGMMIDLSPLIVIVIIQVVVMVLF